MGVQETSFWEPCWACRVAAGEACGCVVAETPDVLVVLNPFALGPGHALVVPRRHVRDLYELPDELAGPVLSTAARVARAAKRAFAADGVTLRQNNGAASDQHLFHFHLHVIPRFDGDLERFNAEPRQAGRAELEAAAARLRLAIEADDERTTDAA
ncbi:MAG TPA: HIT family protein [Pyrinomonadaceae bacterium]